MGGFIVQFVQLWAVAAYVEKCIHFIVGLHYFMSASRFDRICFYVVGIHGVENHNIVISAVGCDWESARLVSKELSRYLDQCHEYHVCFVIVGCLLVFVHVVEIGIAEV